MIVGPAARRALWACASAATLARFAQAGLGSIPAATAVGELAAVWVTVAVVWLIARGAPRLGGAGAAVCGVTLVAVGLGVVAPLWRLAHPAAALYEGRLGGAQREVRTAPARDGGRHRLDIVAAPGASYAVQIDVDGRSAWLRDQAAMELDLRPSQRVNLFVDRSDGGLAVRLRPVRAPWPWVLWAAGAAVVLAVWADAVCTGRRARGALAAAVGWGAALVAMLGPDAAAGAGRLLGAGLLAVVAGLCTGVVAAIAGAWHREMRLRRRRAHHAASGTLRESRARNRA